MTLLGDEARARERSQHRRFCMGTRTEKAFYCSFNSIEVEEMSINRTSPHGVYILNCFALVASVMFSHS
jgi:hypothetical protein